jgi:hypothetical protein
VPHQPQNHLEGPGTHSQKLYLRYGSKYGTIGNEGEGPRWIGVRGS